MDVTEYSIVCLHSMRIGAEIQYVEYSTCGKKDVPFFLCAIVNVDVIVFFGRANDIQWVVR